MRHTTYEARPSAKSCPRLDVVHPDRAWSSSPARLSLFLALSLSPGNSWCDHSMLASLLWRCTPALLRTHLFVFFAVHETHRIFLSPFISKASRRVSSFFLSVQLSQPYVTTGHTSAFISRIFVEIGTMSQGHPKSLWMMPLDGRQNFLYFLLPGPYDYLASFWSYGIKTKLQKMKIGCHGNILENSKIEVQIARLQP